MLRLEDFRHIVPDEVLAGIYAKARRLFGQRIVHVNSTYQGGGVAAILESLVPLMNDVGIQAGWRILHGSPDFFEVTKKFHHALQGQPVNLSERKKDLYVQTNENFSRFTHLDHHCVVVHDPQPLPLIRSYRKQQPWIWRCHVDLSQPDEALWSYLKGFLLKYDLVVVSSEKYLKRDLPLPQKVMFPAINPLALKNRDLDERTVQKYVRRAGIPTDKPFITQVSRLDPWKDPAGLVDVFERVREEVDCRLVFCYNTASDDPEGMRVHNRLRRRVGRLVQRGHVLFVVGNNEILVNSIQRASHVIVQKSLREGFCLAVTEALWKAKPVVASNVGGIPVQIEDGKSGFLLDPHDVKGFADRIVYLLKHPEEGRAMGANGRETVRQRFLITRLLSDYLDILNEVSRGA